MHHITWAISYGFYHIIYTMGGIARHPGFILNQKQGMTRVETVFWLVVFVLALLNEILIMLTRFLIVDRFKSS